MIATETPSFPESLHVPSIGAEITCPAFNAANQSSLPRNVKAGGQLRMTDEVLPNCLTGEIRFGSASRFDKLFQPAAERLWKA